MSDVTGEELIVPWVPPALVQGEVPIDNLSSAKPDKDDTISDTEETITLTEHQILLGKAEQASYQRGLEHAEAKYRESSNQEVERARLKQSLTSLRPQFDNYVTEEILSFAVALAKLIVKREIHTDADYYHELIRRVCSEFSQDTSTISITLHPEDLKLLQNCTNETENLQLPLLQASRDIPRGSCLFETDNFFVDAGVDTLINRVASTLDHRKNQESLDSL